MTQREKITAGVALGAAVFWQIYAVVLAFRHAPVLAGLLEGLGEPLPALTQSFFASYRFWLCLPLIFALLAFDLLRRERPSLIHFSVLLAMAFLAAFVLHAWLQEALFRPLFAMLQALA